MPYNFCYIVGVLLTFLTLMFIYLHYPGVPYLVVASVVMTFAYVIIGIYEILGSDKPTSFEKLIWVFGFIFFSGFTGLFYLLQRSKYQAGNYS